AAAAAFNAVDHRSCAGLAFLTRPLLRQVLAASLEEFDLRAVIPALLYRVNRCGPGDVAAIGNLVGLLSQPAAPSPEDTLSSPVLGLNISLSEVAGPEPPPLAEVQAIEDGAYFATGLSTELRSLYDAWPRYPLDVYAGAYAPTQLPLLMLNGTLDPTTPI